MTNPERIYRGSVRALSVLMLGLGIVILGVTFVGILGGKGGPLSLGILIGLAFVAVGAGRLWLASRMRT
jgi:hypothetical protein